MKKVSLFMALVFAFVMCLPSISVKADSTFSNMFYTSDSVDGYFEGTFGSIDLDTQSQIMYKTY